MGSVRKIKRAKGFIYEATVKIQCRRKSKNFKLKGEANAWIAETETELRLLSSGGIISVPFYEVLQRYENNVSVYKGGARWETVRLKSLRKHPLANIKSDKITSADIAAFRDERLLTVKSSTVNRELNLLSAIFNRCKDEWQNTNINPVSKVKRPKDPEHRDRLVSDLEVEKILHVLDYHDEILLKKHLVAALFLLSMETAMRLGESCSVCKGNYFKTHVNVMGKNGYRRDVPLSDKANGLVKLIISSGLKLNNINVGALFRKYLKQTDIKDLHFHDTRHTAITRLSKKLDVLDLAKMVGHRDLKSLMVYYNPTPKDIASQLN